MNTQVLVLDAGFQPVARVSWKRAVTLLFEGKVEVIESYDDVVRSVTLELQIPAVIRFVRAVRFRRKGLRFSRENVYARDNGRCQYCGHAVPRSDFTYDHVTPRKLGGATSWENIVVCCTPCNQQKGGRTPDEAGMSLKSVPIKPKTLRNGIRLPLMWDHGMPAPWKNWLRDVAYWHVELDE